MRNQLTIMFVLFAISGYASAGKIYKWTDANGQVHFTATPPPQVDATSTGMTTGRRSEPSASSSYKKEKRNSIMERYKKLNKKKQSKDSHRFPMPNVMSGTEKKKVMGKSQPNNYFKQPKKNKNWQSEVIAKCKANRGVDCDNPRYVQSKRPLSEAERETLNKARLERQDREAMNRANRYCLGGRC